MHEPLKPTQASCWEMALVNCLLVLSGTAQPFVCGYRRARKDRREGRGSSESSPTKGQLRSQDTASVGHEPSISGPSHIAFAWVILGKSLDSMQSHFAHFELVCFWNFSVFLLSLLSPVS